MRYPLVYEINTRCWLRDLSERHNAAITLAEVPASEFEYWHRLGFTHIWLMGVWSTGPRSRACSLIQPALLEVCAALLHDLSEADIGGSPYAISGYQVSPALGGEAGLRIFRERLQAHDLKLMLDFIPNHTGLNHPWLEEKPELFVQSRRKFPGTFRGRTAAGPRWLAHGKDPNFPAWNDTAQLDYRNPATRASMIEELKRAACLCDGVRCDMAMLALSDVFARNWEAFPCPARPPTGEFWPEAISAVKKGAPEFLFLGEVYWDLEPRLQSLGFDYTYDKRLYDSIVRREAEQTQLRLLGAPREFHERSAHFLENHDEPRIASLLSPAEQRAAALLILGLPGLRLVHEGQLTGATRHLKVHLARRPHEPPHPELTARYEFLLAALQATAVGNGQSDLLQPAAAWPGNPTSQNLAVVQWQSVPSQFDLVVVNLAPHPSQCRVRLRIDSPAHRFWELTNLLGAETFQRRGADLQDDGLYVDAPGHTAQLWHCQGVVGS